MPPRPPVLPNLRQPLCPYCEYNLTGVYDRTAPTAVRCPECGEEMLPHELHWTRRKGEWTLATGLRGGAVFLLMRSALVAALLVASVFAVEGLGHLLRGVLAFPLAMALFILILVPTGVGCGRLLMRGFDDAAGFYSAALPFAATTALAITGLLVAAALPALYAFTIAPAAGMIFMTAMVALVVIIVDFMSEAV